MQTPGLPVRRPWVAAMNAAVCSWRVRTSLIDDLRIDSTTSRFSSPGMPKIRSTPSFSKAATSRSEPLISMVQSYCTVRAMTLIDDTGRVRREVGTFALLLTGVGSIIGSGWLFGAWRASQLAGIGAIWAWLIGALVATAVGLTYAEMGAMFPESGGMVRYAHYSHGSLLGFIAGWSNWIAVVSVIPVEAEASVQYMASWHWRWAQDLYVQVAGHGELTLAGIAIAAVLVVVYFLINFWGVKLFAHSNTAITVFKLVVPAATGLTLLASGFDARNFGPDVAGNGAADLASILTAVATAGIVFSFNGFQSPVNLAGEARTPGRSIPIAVLGSIFLAAIIYIVLQVAYLGTVPHHLLLTPAGWHGIDFRSPFAQLALLLNLNWLAMLLYADAFMS